MKAHELLNRLSYAASYYLENNDNLVRVSNHLPKISNFEVFEQENKRILLIIISDEITEESVQDFIETNMRSYDVDYMFFNESFEDYDYVINKINKFLA